MASILPVMNRFLAIPVLRTRPIATDPLDDIRFQHPKGGLVEMHGHAQGGEQSLSGIELDDDWLGEVDPLARLRVHSRKKSPT
jgi:hypothetical protein